MLRQRGFEVLRAGLHARPTRLASGMKAWLKVFRMPFFAQYGSACEAVLDEVVELLRPVLCEGDERWSADYVRIRVEAVKR